VAAADGLEALEFFSTVTPDILVTDFHMPGMDGGALIKRVRSTKNGAETPIMVITSDSLRRTKIRLLEVGADEILQKPVERQEFHARLSGMARRAALVDMLDAVKWERDEALDALEARTGELERLTLGLVSALEQANSLNDSSTGNHIQRVSAYAAHLASLRGCSETFVLEVLRYAGLHDVGKVGIPDMILKKPGKLSTEEFDVMKTHTLLGGELLRSAGLPTVASNIALHHHERFDGTGYPYGLAGKAIPLEARIVSVVDVYDALMTKRCYKPAFTLGATHDLLRELAGQHLDPELVLLFLGSSEAIQEIFDRYRDNTEQEQWT
jgi:putative two-component system response regulator